MAAVDAENARDARVNAPKHKGVATETATLTPAEP